MDKVDEFHLLTAYGARRTFCNNVYNLSFADRYRCSKISRC